MCISCKFISVKDDEKRSVGIVQNFVKLIGVLVRPMGAASSVTVTVLQANYRFVICPDTLLFPMLMF